MNRQLQLTKKAYRNLAWSTWIYILSIGQWKENIKKLGERWKLYIKKEKVKAIGVSNFQIHHLKDLMEDAEVKPMVNQVECHPRLTQKEVQAFCKEQGIQLEAWSPFDAR